MARALRASQADDPPLNHPGRPGRPSFDLCQADGIGPEHPAPRVSLQPGESAGVVPASSTSGRTRELTSTPNRAYRETVARDPGGS